MLLMHSVVNAGLQWSREEVVAKLTDIMNTIYRTSKVGTLSHLVVLGGLQPAAGPAAHRKAHLAEAARVLPHPCCLSSILTFP